jgi:hypothetical protein
MSPLCTTHLGYTQQRALLPLTTLLKSVSPVWKCVTSLMARNISKINALRHILCNILYSLLAANHTMKFLCVNFIFPLQGHLVHLPPPTFPSPTQNSENKEILKTYMLIKETGRFEAAMAVLMVIKVSWYTMSYRLENRHKCFGGAGASTFRA